MDAVDQYKLHAQIWEKEIDLLESLSSSLVNFMEPREGISSLFTGLDKDLENLLCCQIKPKPNGRCKYQQLYLKKLYTCLGVDQFRSFLGQFHVVVMSFIRPLMSHIVERNFVDATPINEWSKLSTLAFGIIFWLNTQPSSQGPDLYVDLVALSDTTEAALGSEWTDNRARNMVELKKAFEGFNQMVVGEAISIVGLLDEDSLMDDCKTCWPTDDKSIADRRLKRTELIFKLPKDKILTLMPSFTRNICTPPIEANPKNLLCFIAERNCNSSKKMSRQLMHDKEIVKEWSRLFIESELSKEPSLRLSVPQLKCLQSLLATPEMSVAWYNADSIVWRLFSERSDWFIEKYREIYPVLPKRAIMACIERTPLIVMQTGTIFFLAILRVRDELSEEDLFEIIQLAMRRSFVKNFYVAPSSGALLTDIIVLFQLLISKIACSEILTSKLEANCLIGEPLFTMKIMEECVFRFITPTTPEKRLESALVLVEVSQRYEPAEKKAMRLRVIKMLKKLVQSGHHKELCSKALKKLMTKPNTLQAKRRQKQQMTRQLM